MTYKPSWVANTFLEKARVDGILDVGHLKIQKLVYCLHGWNLAVYNKPVVWEPFEAWKYGPVLSSLYQEFKYFGRDPIDIYITDIDPDDGEKKSFIINKNFVDFYNLFDKVWDRYKNYSGWQLSYLTHREGTPWKKARDNMWTTLDNEDVKKHFINLSKGKENEK